MKPVTRRPLMPRLRDIVGYLWVGAIAAPTLIVGAGTLYHGYNNEKRAAEKDRPKEKG